MLEHFFMNEQNLDKNSFKDYAVVEIVKYSSVTFIRNVEKLKEVFYNFLVEVF